MVDLSHFQSGGFEMPVWTVLQSPSRMKNGATDAVAWETDADSSKSLALFTDCHHAVEYAISSLHEGGALMPKPLASMDRLIELLNKCKAEGATHVLVDPTLHNARNNSSYPIGQFIHDCDTRAA